MSSYMHLHTLLLNSQQKMLYIVILQITSHSTYNRSHCLCFFEEKQNKNIVASIDTKSDFDPRLQDTNPIEDMDTIHVGRDVRGNFPIKRTIVYIHLLPHVYFFIINIYLHTSLQIELTNQNRSHWRICLGAFAVLIQETPIPLVFSLL